MTDTETMAWIKARCTHDGTCLLWTNAMNSSVQPVASHPVTGKTVNIRRMWLEANGHDCTGLMAVVTCDDPRCLTHTKAITRKQLQIQTGKKLRGTVVKRTSNAKSARARSRHTIDQVREWRSAGLTGRQIAELTGLSKGQACKIARGEGWIDYANPFAGLGAR